MDFPRATLTALSAVLLAAPLTAAVAADISAKAELSRAQVSSGEMAELQVRVSGAQDADVPREVPVDGLQIRLTGQSTQVQMVNFKVTSSVVYSYVVMPLRTGNFTIPPVSIRADGRQISTAPLGFSVLPAASAVQQQTSGIPQTPRGMAGPLQRQQRVAVRPPDAGRLAFGEIECPKKTIYAGEMVPVEIRFYFDARYPVQVRGKVDFGSEGVLAERFPDPKESREERDGTTWNVLTFRSLLSAVKPGTVEVAPAKLDSQMQMPGALPPGFDDPVFQQLMGGQSPFSQSRDIAVKTAPLRLEVLPLPKEGRPSSFTGAVGQFDMDAIVPNPRPAAGDPANLVVKIGGKGNFRAMGAPVLTGSDGWRSYPPTDRFEGSDPLSYAGVKSFDFTLIAREPSEVSPGVEFSFFDPVAAKYVTLKSKPLPLQASPGGAAGGSSPAGAPSPAGSQPAAPSPEAFKEGDPLPRLTFRSWSIPVRRPEFLVATGAMAVASLTLAAILALRRLRAGGGTEAVRRRRRIAELRSLLSSDTLDAAGCYQAAVEYADLTVSDPAARERLLPALAERRDALKFGAGGSVSLTREERDDLLAKLSVPVSRSRP